MDIVALIAGNAIAVGVVGYLAKLWIEKRLAHSLEVELAKFRADLAKEVAKDSVQQAWNNSKRMELFAELYEVMIDADFEFKALLLNIKIKKPDLIRDRATKFCEKYLAMNASLHKNELFLDDEIIDEIICAYKPFFDLAINAMESGKPDEYLIASLPDTMEDIIGLGDEPRKRAVKVFKRISGMTPKLTT